MESKAPPHPLRGIAITVTLTGFCLLLALGEDGGSEDAYDYDDGPSGWWFVVAVLMVVLIARLRRFRRDSAARRRHFDLIANRAAEAAWRADLGREQVRSFELLRRTPPQMPHGHEKIISNGGAIAAAGSLAYDHDFSLDLDIDDLFDPFVAAGKLVFWAGGSVMAAYDSLPHRKRALAIECVQVLEKQRELGAKQAAVRPQFRTQMDQLIRRYDHELAATEAHRPFLPGRRRAHSRHLADLRIKRDLSHSASLL